MIISKIKSERKYNKKLDTHATNCLDHRCQSPIVDKRNKVTWQQMDAINGLKQQWS